MARSGRAVLYIPDDGVAERAAMARTTHLAISAHQDDIEFMAYAPIAACFGKADNRFCGSFFVAAPDLLSCGSSCSERSGELCGGAASPVRGSGEWFESAQKIAKISFLYMLAMLADEKAARQKTLKNSTVFKVFCYVCG